MNDAIKPVSVGQTYFPTTENTNYVTCSTTGQLMVALDETRENRLSPKDLRSLLSEWSATGIALHVWDHKSNNWVRLTPEMLEG